MDLKMDGRDICIKLRDDVWILEEAGTLCLTRTQAQMLRLHLNQLATLPEFELEPEDG